MKSAFIITSNWVCREVETGRSWKPGSCLLPHLVWSSSTSSDQVIIIIRSYWGGSFNVLSSAFVYSYAGNDVNVKHHRALGDWRLFNWLIFSQMLFVIVVPIFMPESCRWAKGPVIRLRVSFEWYSYRHRWLMSRGEGKRSVTIMKRIAKMNKKEVFCHYLQFQSLRWWFWLLRLRPSCLQHSDLVTHWLTNKSSSRN